MVVLRVFYAVKHPVPRKAESGRDSSVVPEDGGGGNYRGFLPSSHERYYLDASGPGGGGGLRSSYGNELVFTVTTLTRAARAVTVALLCAVVAGCGSGDPDVASDSPDPERAPSTVTVLSTVLSEPETVSEVESRNARKVIYSRGKEIETELNRLCSVLVKPENKDTLPEELLMWDPGWNMLADRSGVAEEASRCARSLAEDMRVLVEAHIVLGCQRTLQQPSRTLEEIVVWSPEWESVMTRESMLAAVDLCARVTVGEVWGTITGEVFAQIGVETQRLCREVVFTDNSGDPELRWQDSWVDTISYAQLLGDVRDCVTRLSEGTVLSCVEPDMRFVVEDPESFRGLCLITYGTVFQHADWTGCTVGVQLRTDNVGEDTEAAEPVLGLFGPEEDRLLNGLVEECPELRSVWPPDEVRVKATSFGVYEYTSAVDETREALYFRVESISALEALTTGQ